MQVIHEKCEKKAADDKKLPKSSYLDTYVAEEKLTYDIVLADSRVEIFDHYYDKYKEGLQSARLAMAPHLKYRNRFGASTP